MNTFISRSRIAFATLIAIVALSACGAATPTAAPNSAATTAPIAAATTAPATIAAADISAPAATAVPVATTAPAATAVPPTSQAKLNLNEVSGDQLLSVIPNFNSRMVREFSEYRPYTSILQFRKEIGKYVDAAQVAAYEQYVYVPVDVNQADSATIQQIPGVDATIADTLIAARPYASNQAFLDKLSSIVPAAQSAAASTYLTK